MFFWCYHIQIVCRYSGRPQKRVVGSLEIRVTIEILSAQSQILKAQVKFCIK